MKNRSIIALVSATFVFLAFVLGFYFGRSSSSAPVQIAQLPAPVSTEATQAAEQTLPIASDEAAASAPAEAGKQQKININTATAAQLETLPGIGPVLAQRILAYRNANGPFTAVAQLTFVEGIGEKRLMEIMNLITVEQEVTQ